MHLVESARDGEIIYSSKLQIGFVCMEGVIRNGKGDRCIYCDDDVDD